MYYFNIANKLFNLRDLIQSIRDDRADFVIVCVHVTLKVSFILVVFCQDIFDDRTSEGLESWNAPPPLLRCLAGARIGSSFIPGVEMRTEAASACHTFTFVDTGYAHPGRG